ncbi:MAG: HD-GYP domain-containing protein, partial [Lachnospiraceae bacterium]|nr:HD-GYP domain-containing protein [Lachnospiraceae bacterium]
MVVAEDVYTYNNQLIFPKGFVLNDKAIIRMEFYSILYVRVEDDEVPIDTLPFSDRSSLESNVAIPDPVTAFDVEPTNDFFNPSINATPVAAAEPSPSYSERVKETADFQYFGQTFTADIDSFKEAINDIIEKGAPLEVNRLLKQTMDLISDHNNYISIFDMLHNMREYDDCTYIHSVNVALICNVFARWLKMSAEETKLATMCGLLHDIGKLMIPDDIIKKPGKLTSQEYDVIKKHCQEGYKLLVNSELDKHIKNAALMHHERCDGSGYPYGLDAPRIDKYAKMVAIADVYDAMTSARIYRGPLCPFIVISVFENEGLQKYDTRCIMTFLENIVNTYLLNRVRLSNGLEG